MNESPPIPPALRSAAFLFLALGGLGVLYTVILVRRGIFLPSPGLLGFPICFGLLRLSNVSRYIAIAMLGFMLLFLPFFGWRYWVTGGPGQPLFVLIVVLWLVSLWQLYILTRSNISQLFHLPR